MGREIQGVLFISGIPGAGKTTVARIIAQRLSRSAHIESDAIQDLVISGRKHPNEEPREESDRQLMLRERNVAALIDNFVADGFGVIVDDVIAYRARLERYLALIASRPVYLVILAPPLDVSLARDMARSGKTVGHFWSHLDQVIRREMSGLGLWIDSSEMTAEETAGEALKNVIEHGLIAG